MFGHDLTVALRRLLQQRLHTAVGVAVLTLGLLCFVAANLFVSYVRNYDTHWSNSDRTYIVAERVRANDFALVPAFMTNTDAPVAEHVRTEVPELAGVARRLVGQRLVAFGDRRTPLLAAYVEPQFGEIFDFEVLAGDARAIGNPRSALITERGAERLFGSGEAVGQTITIAGQPPVDVTIGGVVADLPNQSHMKLGALFATGFDLLVSWDALEPLPVMGWGGRAVTTYVLLPADGTLTVDELDRRLARIAAERVPTEMSFLNISLETRPVSAVAQMTAQTQFQGFYGGGGWIDILTALRFAAAVILAIACLNFMNLAFVQATGRAADIAMRKVLGATTRQIVSQDLLQTGLIVLLALVLALAAVVAVGGALAAQWSPTLDLRWTYPQFSVFLVATLCAVTAAAGLYPAFVLARVRRASAMRLLGAASDALARLRAVLVGLQFAAASALVVAAIVLLMQRDELHRALVGRFADQYVGVFLNQRPPVDPDVIAAELMRGPGIKGTTTTLNVAFQNQSRRFRRVPDDTSRGVMIDFIYTGDDYFDVMNVPLVAGRVFSRARAEDALPGNQQQWAARQGKGASIVLDSAAASALGWREAAAAVGETIYGPGNAPYTIIGIAERSPAAIRATGSSGTSYVYAPAISQFRVVRIASDQVEAALTHIDGVVKSLSPDGSTRQFFDQLFEAAYWTFELTNRVLIGLAAFALLISGVGLFGMASYLANRRIREIGIRKVQGATPGSILRLLLWDFSKPVVWANVLAWPLVLIAIDRYLSLFAERVAITALPFVVALVTTWLLAGLAVASCAWRAAKLHPAETLRE